MITHKGRARAPIRSSPAHHPRHAEDFAEPLAGDRRQLMASTGLDASGPGFVTALHRRTTWAAQWWMPASLDRRCW